MGCIGQLCPGYYHGQARDLHRLVMIGSFLDTHLTDDCPIPMSAPRLFTALHRLTGLPKEPLIMPDEQASLIRKILVANRGEIAIRVFFPPRTGIAPRRNLLP